MWIKLLLLLCASTVYASSSSNDRSMFTDSKPCFVAYSSDGSVVNMNAVSGISIIEKSPWFWGEREYKIYIYVGGRLGHVVRIDGKREQAEAYVKWLLEQVEKCKGK